MTRTEFFKLVTEAGAEDRKVSLAAQDALIDWWRDEGGELVLASERLADCGEVRREAEATAERLREELYDLQASVVEMICVVCLHDIRHAPICRACVEASVDRHVASYSSTHSLPRLAARA